MSIRTETETVIKKILPYLRRREYDIEKDLDFETGVKRGTSYSKGYVDILVTCGKKKPQFLIEAKKSSKRLSANDREQALAYGEGVSVPFVVLTNGSEIQCFNVANKQPILWNGKLEGRIPTKSQLVDVIAAFKADKEATKIPLGKDLSLPFRPGLPLKQLNALFARCHNAVRKIEKDEENAFSDFSKLLFLKLLEEKADGGEYLLPYSYQFHELADRPDDESDQVRDAVLKMIETIKRKTTYGDVLEDEIRLKNPKTFCYIVKQLASVSFRDSSLDSKGAAFEYFVRATLKGKNLGQYFTPRPLVELMASLVGREKVVNSLLSGSGIKVLDPACGTGGFLVYMLQEGVRSLGERLASRRITKKTHDELKERLFREVFFGSEASPGVACAAKMNMIIAGDGHTNIRAEDSLSRTAKNWSLNTPSCDLVLTNPPFGTSESESLREEEICDYPVRSAKGQHLFLQKMVQSTVAGGEICSVIDDGVLNTESAAELRRWIFSKCEVLAVIRLPEETFKPNKISVSSSVLYLRRREHDDVDGDDKYPVVFADIESLGYLGSGDSIRGFDLNRLKDELSSQLLAVGAPRSGYQWRAFDVDSKEILADSSCRLDYKYWQLEVRMQIASMLKAGNSKTLKELNQITTARGDSPSAELYVDEEDGYALVVKAGTNISKFGELLTDGDYIEKNIYEEMVRAQLKPGDVLLSSTGMGTLGKCCVYRSDKPAIADSHVTIIRVKDTEILPEYLCDYLRQGFGAVQIERLLTGSTRLVELTPEHVDSILVDLKQGVASQKKLSEALRKKEREFQQRTEEAEQVLVAARQEFRG